MAAATVCDVCGEIIEEAEYGMVKVDGKLATGTIEQKSDIGDVCVKCLQKDYYKVARQMFESLQSKRPKKDHDKAGK